MPWFYLVLAGLTEIIWAIGLKYTESFTRPLPTIGVIIAMAISFFFLSLALKDIPIGTAYAVWTGIGAVGVAIIGMIYFGDPVNTLRIIFLTLIIGGVIGLKLSTIYAK
ncbi:Quaternary ammonium compound-resistance protein SugE [Poriferisphaera corsica]|uniref:Guanidinium exporter n=1 Tax=Poriferisphaera corsica TaxID=2528020 RepID=A0A517YR14_9BACT|nr:quaternary ammonium compound efflux SMR transporter SugE [Poriferisphaera corsica]QDU32663.1 Quaternary ammonium compound-resistance protein SugE [Poriferisphaera corsica]